VAIDCGHSCTGIIIISSNTSATNTTITNTIITIIISSSCGGPYLMVAHVMQMHP
jgi:hypothetical protein